MGAVLDGLGASRRSRKTLSIGAGACSGWETPLRRHPSTAILLIIYIPLILIPWVATNILSSRPLTASIHATYENNGAQFSPADLAAVSKWTTAIRVLNTAAALFALPVTSAVMAHAAVVVAQRKGAAQKLNARELVSLADGSWARLAMRNYAAGFTIVGLAFVAFNVMLPLLQSILVSTQDVIVASCLDDPSRGFSGKGCESGAPSSFIIAGYDPEPVDLDRLPQDLIVGRVSDRIIREGNTAKLSHMWEEDTTFAAPTTESVGTLSQYLGRAGDTNNANNTNNTNTNPPSFFVSALPAAFNTGVLRQHAMRLNSTVRCQMMEPDAYPIICPGNRPLEGGFSNEMANAKFCLAGASDASPWSLSRSRQDIEEELFIASWVPDTSRLRAAVVGGSANFTARCVAQTTRGYFELPSLRNNGRHGPLLGTWPGAAKLRSNSFSDLLPNGTIPADTDAGTLETARTQFRKVPSPYGTRDQRTPGPLMTTITAALGKGSFLDLAVAAQNGTATSLSALIAICARGLPFESIAGTFGSMSASTDCNDLANSLVRDVDEFDDVISLEEAARFRLWRIAVRWFAALNPVSATGPGSAANLLSAGVFFANEATLVEAAAVGTENSNSTGDGGGSSSRRIFAAKGTTVTKPRTSGLAVTVTVSVLLALQVLAFLLLAGLVYSVTTPGSRISGAALLLAGARLRDDILPMLSGNASDCGDSSPISAKKWLEDVDASNALRVGGAGKQDEEEEFRMPLTNAERRREQQMAMTPSLGVASALAGGRGRASSFSSFAALVSPPVFGGIQHNLEHYRSPSTSLRESSVSGHRPAVPSPSHSRSNSYDSRLHSQHESPTRSGFHLPHAPGEYPRSSSRVLSRLVLCTTSPEPAADLVVISSNGNNSHLTTEERNYGENMRPSNASEVEGAEPTDPVSPLSDDGGAGRRSYGIAS